MLKFETSCGDAVQVNANGSFYVDVDDASGCGRSRADVEALRDALDRALNVSQDEIDADEAEALRRIYAPVDPERAIPGATVDAEEAERLRAAGKRLEGK